MSEREHAHQLIDRLPEAQLSALVGLLETIVDEDSDTLSPAEAQAIAEADDWSKDHQPIPHEEVLAEYGLTTVEWEKMSRES